VIRLSPQVLAAWDEGRLRDEQLPHHR